MVHVRYETNCQCEKGVNEVHGGVNEKAFEQLGVFCFKSLQSISQNC